MSDEPSQQGKGEAGAGRTAMRILVANEPRSYREAIAGAVRALRPHLAVITVEPEHLDEAAVRHDPDLVLCSRLSGIVESWPYAWVVLYPEGETRALVSIAGRRRTVTADLPFADLLAIIDETEGLVSQGRRSTRGCGDTGGAGG